MDGIATFLGKAGEFFAVAAGGWFAYAFWLFYAGALYVCVFKFLPEGVNNPPSFLLKFKLLRKKGHRKGFFTFLTACAAFALTILGMAHEPFLKALTLILGGEYGVYVLIAGSQSFVLYAIYHAIDRPPARWRMSKTPGVKKKWNRLLAAAAIALILYWLGFIALAVYLFD